MNDRIEKAYEFAKEKHKDQKRKFSGEDYITHLENTANILLEMDETAETDDFIAALLHDVVEDTPTSLKEIGQSFGNEVMVLVEELTTDVGKKKKPVYLSGRINKMSDRAFTIKLCDRLDNVIGLNSNLVPIEFVTRYMEETKFIIINLDREMNGVQKYLLNRIKSTLLYLELNKNNRGYNVCQTVNE